MGLREVFLAPPSPYRGKPFWAWNGRLDEAELRRQIRVFKRMGLGGAFLHSRVGLATPYLSQEWFDLVKACADESRENGMEAWLYDEDRWPSGAAGGLVTKDARYRQRFLRVTITDPQSFEPAGDELGIFLASVRDNTATNVRQAQVAELSEAEDGEQVLAFRCVLADADAWYNDQTYLDTLSKEAVARFIEVTHDAYARHVGEDFGPVMPGIFTDEPNHGRLSLGKSAGNAPWTDALPQLFKDRCGYDLLPHLPEIFFRIGDADFSKVRCDYHDCLAHMFSRNFGEQIFNWCEEHGMLSTGHVLLEESLGGQTAVVSSTMRFYEFMQAPGIDILRGQILTREGSHPAEYLTAKQCSSVLDQFGYRWMLSELYGCTGWHFNFAEHKAVGDWQAALGVNLRCHHLSWYVMLGEAKRDYPASISFQSAWWRDYSAVEDHFARVNLLMTQGKAVRDVAVIHPIESAWGVFYGNVKEPLSQLQNHFMTVQNTLLEEHFDFDYVDEDILSRHGAVEGNTLRVATANYRAVIVPPMLTMRKSTQKHLSDFLDAGGALIFVEPVPGLVDAEPGDSANDLAAKAVRVPLDRGALVDALSRVSGIRRVSITGEDGSEFSPSLYMLRRDPDTGRHLVFICHTRQDESSGTLAVKMPGEGQVQEWDTQTGEVFIADAEETDDGVLIHSDLPGCGSRIFVVDPTPDPNLRARNSYTEVRRERVEPDEWLILRDEPNAFPLDVAEYSIDGGEWKGPLEILKLDQAVRDVAGLRHRGGRMVQPWAQTTPPEAKVLPVSLRYHFIVEMLPDGPCHLVMEEPEKYQIILNGHHLQPDEDEGWWIDSSFRRIRVAPWLLRKGGNEVVLKTDYTPTHGFEALYLTGEFGFKWHNSCGVVTELPRTLALGDWVTQGFACYSSAITYVTDIHPDLGDGQRLFLELPEWEGILVKARLNGQSAGTIAWPPHEIDVTDALVDGSNRLEIEVVSSRRNLLGPLHNTEKYPPWTGSPQFYTKGDQWTDDYVSVPYGLMQAPVLSVRK